MALEHMVWIKFKPGVPPERRRQHLDGLRSLTKTVPGIRHLVVGENITDRAMGYTHGLLVQVDDEAGLKAYLEHPEHLKVARPLREDAETLAMDIVGE